MIITAEFFVPQRLARAKFDIIDPNTKSIWVLKSRDHLLHRPHIADQIIKLLQTNLKSSLVGLEDSLIIGTVQQQLENGFPQEKVLSIMRSEYFPGNTTLVLSSGGGVVMHRKEYGIDGVD